MQSPNLKQLKFMRNAAGILLYNIIYLLHVYFQIWLIYFLSYILMVHFFITNNNYVLREFLVVGSRKVFSINVFS